MDPPSITVAALGGRSLAWLPTGEEPAVILAPELEERRQAFVRYIEDTLESDDGNNDNDNDNDSDSLPAALQVTYTIGCHAALVFARDPALAGFFLGPLRDDDRNLDGPRLSAWLGVKLAQLEALLVRLIRPWTEQNAQNGPRPASEKKAQSEVRAWYGNKCVLTGVDRTEGAHIVPVRVTRRGGLQHIWFLLSTLFPVDRFANLSYRGRESENILPLARGAHSRWDAFEFYLRPIPDPITPSTRLYLQLVWSDEDLAVGTPGGDAVLPEVINGRRPMDGVAAYQPVCTGDVFLLETADPINCPLPSLELLQFQAGVHRILGGLRAAATLASLFCGPPPDDDNDDKDDNNGIPAVGSGPQANAVAARISPEDDSDLPHLWRVLLEAAFLKSVLSLSDAGCWARAFARLSAPVRTKLAPVSPSMDSGPSASTVSTAMSSHAHKTAAAAAQCSDSIHGIRGNVSADTSTPHTPSRPAPGTPPSPPTPTTKGSPPKASTHKPAFAKPILTTTALVTAESQEGGSGDAGQSSTSVVVEAVAQNDGKKGLVQRTRLKAKKSLHHLREKLPWAHALGQQ